MHLQNTEELTGYPTLRYDLVPELGPVRSSASRQFCGKLYDDTRGLLDSDIL